MKILRIDWGRNLSFVDNYSGEQISEGQIDKFIGDYKKYLTEGDIIGTQIELIDGRIILYNFEDIHRVVVYKESDKKKC
jgi:hypothetical protein